MPIRDQASFSTQALPCRSIEDQMRESIHDGRRPVLVVGSGLLRQVNFGPFADWSVLLHEVAHWGRVPLDAAFARDFPTLCWEAMLVALARRNRATPQSEELKCLPIISDVVDRASSRIETSRFSAWQTEGLLQSIISLNFTSVPFMSHTAKPTGTSPFPFFGSANARVWCPHGHFGTPRSIRLSSRKYTHLCSELEEWRGRYKKECAGKRMMPRKRGTHAELHFIADVLESPLIFAGCGLHSAEWTLWWLLATKARNEARQPACPSVYVTANELDTSHHAALRGLNCCVLKVSEHSEVWDRVESLVRHTAS
jgi:hypothetical protein